jgi:hypothetical protein
VPCLAILTDQTPPSQRVQRFQASLGRSIVTVRGVLYFSTRLSQNHAYLARRMPNPQRCSCFKFARRGHQSGRHLCTSIFNCLNLRRREGHPPEACWKLAAVEKDPLRRLYIPQLVPARASDAWIAVRASVGLTQGAVLLRLIAVGAEGRLRRSRGRGGRAEAFG